MPPPDSPVMIRISMLVPFSADDPHLRLQMHAVGGVHRLLHLPEHLRFLHYFSSTVSPSNTSCLFL